MKRLLMILLSAVIVLSGLTIPSAAAADTSVYAQSMQRMMDLGVFSSTAPDKMDLQNGVTREQLATVLILLNGQEEKTSLYKNTSLFSDVASNRWSTGYIGAAVKLGYMKAMPDGLFHPTEKITFTQVAVIFGDLLRYDDYNLTGSFPNNYLNLLKNLGILEGISYTAGGTVTRGQLAVMADRLLQTKVFGGNQVFIDTLGVYKNLIVLENSVINKNSDSRRILTDIGVYYMDASLKVPAAGKKFVVRIQNDQIVKMALANISITEVSVKYINNGKILTNTGESVFLPSNLTYYYKGMVSGFDAVNASIRTNSSIVIGKKSDGTGYGVLFDPVTSDPRVITSGTTTGMLESLYSGKTIDREGKYIKASQIEADDVVYEISDIWGKNGYVIIYANSVSGEIKSILPNKVSPTSIVVDGKTYPLSPDFPMEKLVGQGSVQVDQTCKLLLNSSGQAVDIIAEGDSNNKNFALVLNAYEKASTDSKDFGTKYRYVNLLLHNGSRKTYLVEKDMIELKGRLVTYTVTKLGPKDDDYDTVELAKIDYTIANASRIEKEDRMIDGSTVANDAIIFNLVSDSFGADSVASVLKFSDLPNGNIEYGKVKYFRTVGDFQDIDVILFNNILDEGLKYGLVTGVVQNWSPMTGTIQTITAMIDGTPVTFNDNSTGIYVGEALCFKTYNNAAYAVDHALTATVAGNKVDAADSTRIRMNNVTYNYKSDVTILKYENDAWKEVGTSEITKDNSRYVSVYLDKPVIYGGKVILVTIR